MSQVFYRKWRPKLLTDVVGQDHVTMTLKQAIISGRVAHAYLFCGPRGTGKTSTARILAKAVNCLNPSQGEPCNQCHICKAVNDGNAMDIIEMDAASHRGIDDVRNLREKVNFTPAEATYKVYIIDEAHMLTDSASNAILKTLEEPPPHAIFILATTEVHKLPTTVVSRCQRFDFRRIFQEHIELRLAQLCDAEGIETEYQVLKVIARNASGSLRDAENLLEQLAVSYDSKITMTHLRDMLGLSDDDMAMSLVSYILKGKAREGLMIINAVEDRGLDLRRFHRQIVDYMRGVLLIRAGVGETVLQSEEVLQIMHDLSEFSTLERIFRAVRAFEMAFPRNDSPSTLSLELALVECSLDSDTTHETQVADVSEDTRSETSSINEKTYTTPSAPVSSSVVDHLELLPSIDEISEPIQSTDVSALSEESATPSLVPNIDSSEEEMNSQINGIHKVQKASQGTLTDTHWEAIRKATRALKPGRFNIGSLLLDCVNRYIENDMLVLVFKTRPNMERLQSEIDNPDTRRLVQETVERATGIAYTLRLILDDGNPTGNASKGHLVRAARAIGAHIIEEVELEENANE